MRDAIPLLVAVGDVGVDVGIILRKELIHECHGGTSVHVVVAIDEDSLLVGKGAIQPIHSALHIVHEEGIVEVGELRTEEAPHLAPRRKSSFYEQLRQGRVQGRCHVGLLYKACRSCRLEGSRFIVYPLIFHVFFQF